jgi:uncharacterized protein (UPF0262 family)
MSERRPLRVIIDDEQRQRARPDRLVEWDHAVAELAARQAFAAALEDGVDTLAVALESEALRLELRSPHGTPPRQARVPLQPLRRLIGDYLLIIGQIEQLEEGWGSPRFDALDMAKRVYHDEAAEVVQRTLASALGPDLETARRLFTLLLVMTEDTSVTAGRR